MVGDLSSKETKVRLCYTGGCGQREATGSADQREGVSVGRIYYFLSRRRPVSGNLSSPRPFHQRGLAGSSLDISGSDLIKY